MEGLVWQSGVVVGVRVSAAFSLAVFLLLGLPLIVSAYERPEVVINEIMWDGDEYIELYNPGEDEVELVGWKLVRQELESEDEKDVVRFSDGDLIESKGYYLIEDKEKATTVLEDKVESFTLLNTGEKLQLYSDRGEVIDEANYFQSSNEKGWAAGDGEGDGVAMERSSPVGDGGEASSWHSSTAEVGGRLGTPGQKNSEPAINTPPEAIIEVVDEALVGEEIVFSATDSNDEDSDELVYSWFFGDGETDMGEEVTHKYSSAGIFTVMLMVSDGELEDEEEVGIEVTQPNYSDDIVINEFLPNPEGSDSENEFIELKNIGSEEISLIGWQLDDKAGGGSKPYVIGDVSIDGGKYRVFYRSETKITLNNSQDEVRLLNPLGDVVSSYDYEESVFEGQSYNRESDGDYVLSEEPTPGEENVIIMSEEDDDDEEDSDNFDYESDEVLGDSVVKVELADIRDEEVGTEILTVGVVSVPPGVLGDKIMYLAGSGVQVYFYKEEYPELSLGDEVEIQGETSTSLGEYRVKITEASGVKKLKSGEPPSPHQVRTGQVDEDLEGTLVIIEGEVTRTSGDTFYIDDGSGEVKIFIKTSTEIDKPKMKKGVAVTITGVVSRTKAGYRVLPRFQEDVRLGRVAGMTSFPATGLAFDEVAEWLYGGGVWNQVRLGW